MSNCLVMIFVIDTVIVYVVFCIHVYTCYNIHVVFLKGAIKNKQHYDCDCDYDQHIPACLYLWTVIECTVQSTVTVCSIIIQCHKSLR